MYFFHPKHIANCTSFTWKPQAHSVNPHRCTLSASAYQFSLLLFNSKWQLTSIRFAIDVKSVTSTHTLVYTNWQIWWRNEERDSERGRETKSKMENKNAAVMMRSCTIGINRWHDHWPHACTDSVLCVLHGLFQWTMFHILLDNDTIGCNGIEPIYFRWNGFYRHYYTIIYSFILCIGHKLGWLSVVVVVVAKYGSK